MKITELELRTAQPVLMKTFYSKILNLPVTGNEDHFIIQAGETKLSFVKTPQQGKDPFYHFAFNIPCNKIEESLAFLKGKADPLSIEAESYIADFRNWHAKSVYFIDPAGNIVEFIARFDLDDPETETFSPNQIRCVSEMGIVFPAESFDNDANSFLEKYDLNYFNKQPPLPQFRAIGDDHGLLIVVHDKRNWYPTNDKSSGIFPMKIKFQNKGRTELINM